MFPVFKKLFFWVDSWFFLEVLLDVINIFDLDVSNNYNMLLPHALYIHCHVIVHILCLVVFNNLSDLIGIILIPL